MYYPGEEPWTGPGPPCTCVGLVLAFVVARGTVPHHLIVYRSYTPVVCCAGAVPWFGMSLVYSCLDVMLDFESEMVTWSGQQAWAETAYITRSVIFLADVLVSTSWSHHCVTILLPITKMKLCELALSSSALQHDILRPCVPFHPPTCKEAAKPASSAGCPS